jgi:hypothetical protein
MSKQELDNLATIGQLKAEPGARAEFVGLVESARKRLVAPVIENDGNF